MRAALLALLAALVLVPVLVPGPAAAAAGPDAAPDCWKHLLRDYADNGRIDETYAASCYRESIRRMPSELSSYSDAYDVLTRALASATARPVHEDGVLVVPPPAAAPASTTTEAEPPAPFTRVTNRFATAEPDRVPVPLLVLGGVAVLFVAAGVAGTIARRRGRQD